MNTPTGISILAEDMRKELWKVLDFVERHNNQDKEEEVSDAAQVLSKLLYD